MQAKQLDIMVTWGHLYISLNQPAIERAGDCVPNSELFRRLAKTMGSTTTTGRTDEQMLIDFHDGMRPRCRASLREVERGRLDATERRHSR